MYTDSAYECPQGFWVNVPPNFIPIHVRHQGEVTQARYVTIKFYPDPIIWGTMGQGFRAFEQPAHVVPRLTDQEATPYLHNDLRLLTSRYPRHNWVNHVLIDEGDKGLRAEVHCYQRMADTVADKEAELNVIQDCLTVLTLDLRASMWPLSRAEAVVWIEDWCTMATASRGLSAWVVEQGHST